MYGEPASIEPDSSQQLSMLRILYGASAAALDAFRAADSAVDRELVGDLERIVRRTRLEIDRLAALFVNPSEKSPSVRLGPDGEANALGAATRPGPSRTYGLSDLSDPI